MPLVKNAASWNDYLLDNKSDWNESSGSLWLSYNVFFLLTVVDIDSFYERNTWSLDSQKTHKTSFNRGIFTCGQKATRFRIR